MFLNHKEEIRSNKIDQKIARDLLVVASINPDFPFSFVEYDGIKD